MWSGSTIIALIIAIIFVIVSLVFEFLESKDRKAGLNVKHKDYTISGMARLMLKEHIFKIKSFFTKLQQKSRKGKQNPTNVDAEK